jgi:glycerol kinase
VASRIGGVQEYAVEGSIFIAGAAVQWLRDGLHLFRTAAEVEQLARASNPNEPVIFVPGFVGLGAPHWVPEARAVVFGLTRGTTSADLARASLEGVALQVTDLIDAAVNDLASLSSTNKEILDSLKVDGGMARNDWFLQCQADILGRPVLRAAQSESTALGAGLTDEAKLRSVLSAAATRFEPKLAAADRERKVATWRKAVQAVIGFYTR